MRDAAGQVGDDLAFLGLPELGFELLDLLFVSARGQHVAELACNRAEQGKRRRIRPEELVRRSSALWRRLAL